MSVFCSAGLMRPCQLQCRHVCLFSFLPCFLKLFICINLVFQIIPFTLSTCHCFYLFLIVKKPGKKPKPTMCWLVWVLGPLLQAMKSLDNQNDNCVCILCKNSIMCSVCVGLCQGFLLSQNLIVIFMDWLSKRSKESIRFGEFRIASLIFADDLVLLALSHCDLQHALGRFAVECEVGM